MKQFWTSFFGAIIGVVTACLLIVVFIIFLIGGMIANAVQSADATRSNQSRVPIVLELDLRPTRLDQSSQRPLAFAEPISMSEITMALSRAARDERILGVFVRANAFGMAPGQAEEIRASLASFAQSGKPVYAHAQGFEGPAIANYYAVSSASSLWLQESASFSASGYASETVFLGDLIERVGAQADFVEFYEFKNASSSYTESGYTQAHRDSTLSWLGSLYDTAISRMASDRSMDRARMQALIEGAPYSAEHALERQLVDRLGHVFDARLAISQEVGGRARFVDIDQYARSIAPNEPEIGPVIALINAQGVITTGPGQPGLTGEDMIGSDRLTRLLDHAASNNRVRAIVLRVDSPGGSAIASDQIHNAVLRARAAGKPVVVSMGSVAASGGYYIAAPADRIVAHPSTLTGSIGVVTGKLVVDGALERIGVNIEPLSVGGEFTTTYSNAQGWSETQREAVERLTNDVYVDFTERVAAGRDLPLSRVQEIARGRVWTGAQALELGLVDRLGGLNEAVEEAKKLAGLDEGDLVQIQSYAPTPNPFMFFQNFFGSSAEVLQMLGELYAISQTDEVQALLDAQRWQAPATRLETSEQVVVPDAE